MKISETIGMMSTGALLMLGGVWLFGPEQQVVVAPITPVAQAAAPQPAQPAEAPAQVTRARVDLTEVSPAQQIETIVALSEQGIDRSQDLSPEQLEVIAFFEDTARHMNEATRDRTDGAIMFSNMAVSQLNVRYFYRVPLSYEAMDRTEIMTNQTALVTQTLCQGEAIQTLMQDYGFTYTYNYLSADNRLIGRVEADAAACA